MIIIYDKRKFRKGNLLCVYLGGCLIHAPLCNHRVYGVMLLCVFCVHLFMIVVHCKPVAHLSDTAAVGWIQRGQRSFSSKGRPSWLHPGTSSKTSWKKVCGCLQV